MARYIDREQAKEQILVNARIIQKPHLLSTEDTLYILDCLPTADVVEVKHGEWIENGIQDSMLSKCSVCGISYGAYTFNYCPNCGAKMDGGSDT